MAVSTPSLLTANGSSTPATSYNTASVAWDAGDLVCVFVGTADVDDPTNPPSSVASGAFALTRHTGAENYYQTGGFGRRLSFFYGIAGSSGSAAFTISYSPGVANCNWSVFKVTGHDTTTPILQVKPAPGNGTSGVATLDSAVSTGSTVMAVVGVNASKTITSEHTEISEVLVTGFFLDHDMAVQYHQTTDTGPSFSWSGSSNWGAITVEIQQLATPPPSFTPRMTLLGVG